MPPHTDAGSYPITCTGANAGPNYTITYTPATLTVSRATTALSAAALLLTLLRPTATTNYTGSTVTGGLLGS